MDKKRAFDLFLSFTGFLILLPLFAIISLWIKLDSKGPVFFRQERVGRYGRPFRIYKFRTMNENAELCGGQITSAQDPRITLSGRFLRKFKIDELPQLINVIKGEMSMVGPRPEVRRYVCIYSDAYKNILKIRPGITDMASVLYRKESNMFQDSNDAERVYIHDILPEKIRLAEEYMKNSSITFDLRIIITTLLKIPFSRRLGWKGGEL